jgi:hypothetical protein
MLVTRGVEGPVRFYIVTKEDGTRPTVTFDDLRNVTPPSREVRVLDHIIRPTIFFKDLRKAAEKSTVETSREGPYVGVWRPFELRGSQ